MKLKSLLILILLTVFGIGNLFAQKNEDKVNFNGSWVLDSKKSAEYLLNRRLPISCNSEINIIQKKENINIQSKEICHEQNTKYQINQTFSFFKKGEINKSATGENIYTEAALGKRSLIIKKYELKKNNEKGKLLWVNEMKLSKDGLTMIITVDNYTASSKLQIPLGRIYSEFFYTKK